MTSEPGHKRAGATSIGVVTLLAAGLLASGGCAKDVTSVFVTVEADATVPPILILRTAVAPAGDPARQVSSNRSSPYAGDAADRPGPFLFPLGLTLTMDPSLAGPAVVTVEGIDWDSGAVTARGEAAAVIAAQASTSASLTLTAVAGAGGERDGGVD